MCVFQPAWTLPTHLHLPGLSRRGAAKRPRPHFGRSGVGTPMAALQPPSAAPSQKGALREGAWRAAMWQDGGPTDFRWLTLRKNKATKANAAYVPASCLVTWCDWTIDPNDTWHSLSWAVNGAYQVTVGAAGVSRQTLCLDFWDCWLRFILPGFTLKKVLQKSRCILPTTFCTHADTCCDFAFYQLLRGAKTADKVSNIFQPHILW